MLIRTTDLPSSLTFFPRIIGIHGCLLWITNRERPNARSGHGLTPDRQHLKLINEGISQIFPFIY